MKCKDNLDFLVAFCNEMLNTLPPTVKLATTKELNIHINALATELSQDDVLPPIPCYNPDDSPVPTPS